MGKTTRPISILCIGVWGDEFVTLQDQGHRVDHCITSALDMDMYDVIIGPKCWRYLPDVSDKFIKLIIKEARATQPTKPKKVKKEKVK